MSLFSKQPLQGVGPWWKRQSLLKKGVMVAVVLAIGLVVASGGSRNKNATVETVKRQNLIRSVSASGNVVSSTDLALQFEERKVVSSIKVQVGDTVKKGDVLATLSNATERAALVSAKGSLLAARARYNKVLEGSSSEEIQLAQTQLDSAKKTQDNLVANALRKLYSDDLTAQPQGGTLDEAPIVTGNYNGTKDGDYYISFPSLNTTEARYSGLENGSIDVSTLPHPLGKNGLSLSFPATGYSARSSWDIMIPNKNGAHYTENLNAYQQAVAARDAAVAEAQANLDLIRATARQPDIDAALADVVTAQAGVDSANAALEHTILRAPADGTITAVNVKIGEIPSDTTEAIDMQDVSNLYLQANVNESDIKDVLVGQPVTVTFDAFPGQSYHATVSSIDPAATIENNVVNYKVKALLADTDAIKPGMTADMTIQTAERANVLVLPQRVIQTAKDGKPFVALITDDRHDRTTLRPVTTGLVGDGKLVEITNGLVEGDRVLWTPSTQ